MASPFYVSGAWEGVVGWASQMKSGPGVPVPHAFLPVGLKVVGFFQARLAVRNWSGLKECLSQDLLALCTPFSIWGGAMSIGNLAVLHSRGLEMPWRRQWHPTPVLLPGKSHGRRSLVGCSPWGCAESDTTERFHFDFSLSCIGEGNGNHSSVLAWRIPGTGEPDGCRLWSHTESDMTEVT